MRLICIIICLLICSTLKAAIPDCCQIQYFSGQEKNSAEDTLKHRSFSEFIVGSDDKTWSDVVRGGDEPKSFIESIVLGTKIGVLIVSPIVLPIFYFESKNLLKTGKIGVACIAGSWAFVTSFWLVAEIGRVLGIYEGLETPQKSTKPFILVCNCE